MFSPLLQAPILPKSPSSSARKGGSCVWVKSGHKQATVRVESESNSRRSGSSSNGGETRKIAPITGITGQDGSYLTEFLLKKGYEVHGLIRRSSNFNTQRINHIYIAPHNSHQALMKLHDASSLRRWLDTILSDEVYNLAAQSHVAVSFEIPDYTADVVATGALRLLEAVRSHISATGRSHIKYYQAGFSEMFGSSLSALCEETRKRLLPNTWPRI